MASDIIERWKASAQRQLCLPLLPFTHARSESINADSLNSNFLQLERRSGGRPQRAVHPHAVTCQQCDTHYFSRPRTRNLPIVGWLLVRRASSSATDSHHIMKNALTLWRPLLPYGYYVQLWNILCQT